MSLSVAAAFILQTIATPIGKNSDKSRRSVDCVGNDDPCLEERYWAQTVPMGFFINTAGGMGGSDTAGAKRALSNPPGPLSAGSGSGSHVITRSDIPKEAAIVAPAPAPAASQLDSTSLNVAPAVKVTTDDSPRKSLFCQGEKEWLQCPMYRVIKINKAFWGRADTKPCSDKAVTRTLTTDKLCTQDEANTMKKVETMCNDEEACELVASDTFFDRSDCADVYKYVELDYQCLHREMRVKDTSDKSG